MFTCIFDATNMLPHMSRCSEGQDSAEVDVFAGTVCQVGYESCTCRNPLFYPSQRPCSALHQISLKPLTTLLFIRPCPAKFCMPSAVLVSNPLLCLLACCLEHLSGTFLLSLSLGSSKILKYVILPSPFYSHTNPVR